MAAHDMSESRIKELIKSYGGPDALPRRKRGSEEKLQKSDYIGALLDAARFSDAFKNDYAKIADMLQSERVAAKGKKGFGSRS